MGREHTAVIILNYKSWQDTLSMAEAVHELLDIGWEQIIIIDNASPNESAEKLRSKPVGGYVFLEAGKNGGYASGNNIGLRYACEHGFKYGWILNNDIIIEDSGVLDEMVRVMETERSVAAVNPDIYSPDGYMYNRNSKRRSLWDYTFGTFFYKKKGRRLEDMGGYGYIYRPQGCCMLLCLEKLKEIGFLDERTFLYYEEPILAERLLKKNYRAACAFRVKVIHNHSNTVKATMEKKRIIKVQDESFRYYLTEYRGFNRFETGLCLFFSWLEGMIS